MGYYLYKIRPTRQDMLTAGSTPAEEQVINEHFAYLKRLTLEGVVQLAGRTQNNDHSAFGIVIFRAENDSAAQNIMQADPAVKKRVMSAELYPYRIALLGDFPDLDK